MFLRSANKIWYSFRILLLSKLYIKENGRWYASYKNRQSFGDSIAEVVECYVFCEIQWNWNNVLDKSF